MKIKHPYQKQILPAAVGREGLAVETAESKSTGNRLLDRGVAWQ